MLLICAEEEKDVAVALGLVLVGTGERIGGSGGSAVGSGFGGVLIAL